MQQYAPTGTHTPSGMPVMSALCVHITADFSTAATRERHRRPEGSGTIRTRAGETSRHSARIWRGLFFYTKITEHGGRAVASFIWIHRMRAQSNIKRSSPLITRSYGRWQDSGAATMLCS